MSQLVPIEQNALTKSMNTVIIDARIKDETIVTMLKRSAVLNDSGAAAQMYLWDTLAEVSTSKYWKTIVDNSTGSTYTNFAKFALDFVPGLSVSPDGKVVKESTVRAYQAAGEVLRAVPELKTIKIGSDALNTLHSLIGNPDSRKAIADNVESISSMTTKELRAWVSSLSPKKTNGKSPKPERLYKYEVVSNVEDTETPNNDDEPHVKTITTTKLLTKHELEDIISSKIAADPDTSALYLKGYNRKGTFVLFHLPSNGKPTYRLVERETEEEAQARVDAEKKKRLDEISMETRYQEMYREFISTYTLLVPQVGEEKGTEIAISLMSAKYPEYIDGFREWNEAQATKAEDLPDIPGADEDD